MIISLSISTVSTSICLSTGVPQSAHLPYFYVFTPNPDDTQLFLSFPQDKTTVPTQISCSDTVLKIRSTDLPTLNSLIQLYCPSHPLCSASGPSRLYTALHNMPSQNLPLPKYWNDLPAASLNVTSMFNGNHISYT